MATRLKTVEYAFPALASLANNTLTNLTQITLYLPETGTKTFRSVVAKVSMDDIITATGGSITTKTLALRLGAAGYTTISNTSTLSNSGEQISLFLAQDFTSHFTTNWTGTSMTCDFQLQINQSTGTTLGMVNVCVTLEITYEYDDTSTIHVETAYIPLNMPVGHLATSATTYDTIPALDTYLPEASKTYRNIFVLVQGNEGKGSGTTDHTMTLRVGTANVTTGNYESALSSDRFFRYVWQCTSAWPSTGSTQTWQPTSSVATRLAHLQAYLVVTYEFNASTTSRVMHTLLLPMEVDSPMGTSAADFQRATRELLIQEQNVSSERIAFYAFWSQYGLISGLNMRIGTGSFVAYTDAAAVLCGNNAGMVRNDAAFTLARGRNSLNFDCYNTDAADYGQGVSGFWIVNYTSDKHADGVGAHNHTVKYSILQNETSASATIHTSSSLAIQIPETEYYITALGAEIAIVNSGTNQISGLSSFVERLSAEGGQQWERVYLDQIQSDPEVGVFWNYSQVRSLFKRFPTDPEESRMDIETARRWRSYIQSSSTLTGWLSKSLLLTYHSITYTISGTVSEYTGDGSGIEVDIFRKVDGERQHIGTATTAAGGTYSFTWYDDTEEVFATAAQSSTLTGRSADGVAV